MSNFQAPPTWAELILVNRATGVSTFNPIWLNWFISLTQNIGVTGPVTSVTASAPLASSGGVSPNITLTVILAANFPALTGDITTAGGTLATVLKNTGTAGTYTKITFDAQGRETSGATAAASDLSNGTTGSGAVVLAGNPTMTTPVLGVATATSLRPAANGYISSDGTVGLTQASTTTLGKSITLKDGLVVAFA